MTVAFLQLEGKSPENQILLKILKRIERIGVNVLKVDNVLHLVLLKYHGLFLQHPATLLQINDEQ